MLSNTLGKLYFLLSLILLPMSIISLGMYSAIGFLHYELKKESKTLPPLPKLENLFVAGKGTSFLDRHNKQFEHFTSNYQIYVPLDKLPSIVSNAFIAAEDQNFWFHNGIDFQALIRAAFTQIRGGVGMSGGSTISEQLAKNIAIGNAHTLRRKIREAIFARRLEKAWGKKTILSAYLNSVYLGEGAFGVEAASQTWFGKHASQLEPYEAAFLGGLPKMPSGLNPKYHAKRAYERRHYVLSRMCALKMISCDKLDFYNKQPLPTPHPYSANATSSTWYGEIIRRDIIANAGSEIFNGQYGGGLVVHTNEDPSLSALAGKALLHGLIDYDKRHGLPQWQDSPAYDPSWHKIMISSCSDISCIDTRHHVHSYLYSSPPPHRGEYVWVTSSNEIVRNPIVQGSVLIADLPSGRVLAAIGGLGQPGGFDRNTQSKRQPGSLAKIAITWSALLSGYQKDTPLLDVPITLNIGRGPMRWSPGGDGLNDGMGVITLDKAFTYSRNQAYVRLANDLGEDIIRNGWRNLGIYEGKGTPLSAILGGVDTYPMNVLTMLGRTLSGNMEWQPSFYESVTTNLGDSLVMTAPLQTTPNGNDQHAQEIKEMLHNVVKSGTASKPFKGMDITDIGGKTGTSNNVRDSWFGGFYKDKVILVHVGYDNGRYLGDREFGATIAAPIASDIIRNMSNND